MIMIDDKKMDGVDDCFAVGTAVLACTLYPMNREFIALPRRGL